MTDPRADLAARLTALNTAVSLARGRLDDAVLESAEELARRAGERMAISGEHTVVALAGATGSGKSTIFNALSGTEFATTGVRRPTTSEAMAVAWGEEVPTQLLDWLEVRRRQLVPAGMSPWRDVVLLDLPDHDSTEREHQVTVDRLVKLVDMLIWVVDPQKYADGALHDGYLRPLADQADIMTVVLNQADRLAPDQLAQTLDDLRRLLVSEGLGEAPVLATSALTGAGINDLRTLIERAAANKAMAVKRFSTDATREAQSLSVALGSGRIPRLSKADLERLNSSLGEAAGVPIVVERVWRAWHHRGSMATGWPFVSWLLRFRPDPLRALRLGQTRRELAPTEVSRSSLPKATSVQVAKVETALRELTRAATAGIPRGWADHIGAQVQAAARVLPDRLDVAVAGTDLRMDRGHGWWSLVRVLQWVLVLATVVGGIWLAIPLVAGLVQAPLVLPEITWLGWPIQTLLFLGGVGGGVLLAFLSRLFVGAGARVRARTARRALTEAVGEVTATELVEPIRAELDRLSTARDAVSRA
ncbi:MAG: GTPase family protein [Propioniciclava sp.]